jgi:hypothetical protein
VLGKNQVCSTELGLEGDLAVEWESYRRKLIDTRIFLVDRQDELLWNEGDSSGQISVKNVYEALSNKIWRYKIGGWRRNLWTWDCPMKIKLFFWLVGVNKVLTWENLQKKGWKGPGMCYLCRVKGETSNHIFVTCPFTITVWEEVKKKMKFTHGWSGTSVNECMQNWYSQNHNYPSLLAFICWNIWLDRNNSIF